MFKGKELFYIKKFTIFIFFLIWITMVIFLKGFNFVWTLWTVVMYVYRCMEWSAVGLCKCKCLRSDEQGARRRDGHSSTRHSLFHVAVRVNKRPLVNAAAVCLPPSYSTCLPPHRRHAAPDLYASLSINSTADLRLQSSQENIRCSTFNSVGSDRYRRLDSDLWNGPRKVRYLNPIPMRLYMD